MAYFFIRIVATGKVASSYIRLTFKKYHTSIVWKRHMLNKGHMVLAVCIYVGIVGNAPGKLLITASRVVCNTVARAFKTKIGPN